MSEHSEFIILRSDNSDKKYVKNLNSAYELFGVKPGDKDLFGKEYKESDLPNFLPSKKLKYANKNTKQEYDIIMEQEFNSEFTVLKDEYNISNYGNKNQIEISYYEAKQIDEAISYLLLEKYDKKLEEEVLNNKFIKLFGDVYAPYFNYYMNLSNPTNNEDIGDYLRQFGEEYRSENIMLRRIKIILDTFINLKEENEYNDLNFILLYMAC